MASRVLDRSAAEVKIDPRIAARRDAVQNEKRRRRGRWWLVAAIVVAVLVGAWFITRTPLLDVDRIKVDGATVTTAEDIISSSGIRPGEALLEIDASASASHIRQLPHIASALVVRKWNGTIAITVTERVPVALAVGADGVAMLIDGSGRVIGTHVAGDGVETVLMGVEAGSAGTSVEGVSGALEAASLLTPGMRNRIAGIATAPDGSLNLTLTPQGIVIMGPPTDLPAKVDSLRIVMGQVDQRDLASINVVNPTTPVVVRTPK
jgi:cell division septal protein FtsQ